jgi:WD40 repeat protein
MIWDAVTGESFDLDGHSRSVLCTSFSSDGSHVVSESRDQTVRIWNAVTGVGAASRGT